VLLNDAKGGFEAPVIVPVGDMPFDVASADFNQDGYLDLTTCNFWDGTLSVAQGYGDGTFKPAVSMPMDSAHLQRIVTGDFDRNGHQDIVFINGFDYTVSFVPGRGDGTFGTRLLYSSGNFPRGLATADFDGDGDLDVAIANMATDGISSLRNLTPPPAEEPADLDGDGTVGLADLLILLAAWGPCPADCPADLDGSGAVGLADLLMLLAAWG
jgi:hypothetical protein